MKNSLKVALATIALAGMTSVAHADLTINGAVGLPLNPTAQIPEPGGIRLQGNYFDLADGVKNYGILAAGRVAGTLEINGGVTRLDGAGFDRNGLAIGAKYLFSRETDPEGVRLAVGAGYDRALLKQTYAYGVASKYLGAVAEGRVPLTGHLGIRYDRFSDVNSRKASVFGGIEIPIAADGTFQAVGEVGSKNIDGGSIPYSASLRYRPKGQPFGASVGIARQGAGDSGLFAQVGYTFGK